MSDQIQTKGVVLPADPLAAYQTGVSQERERCAAIVRAKKPAETRLWWLRDELENLAQEIERVADVFKGTVFHPLCDNCGHHVELHAPDMTCPPDDETTDLLDVPLPCDVRIGDIIITKGAGLRVLVELAKGWRLGAQRAELLEFELDDLREKNN